MNDNGNEFKVRMMAGSVGIRSEELLADESDGVDTLQPELGWWMIMVKPESDKEEL